ncbi:MAG: ABC transporter ATP-binding protein/permease [Firmicutes bacterium]|nr:ABC transporter ATP-binding protein/permease [Bacillota bacterium]
MLKLTRYLKGYGLITVIAPLLKLLEALFELAIPLIVRHIADVLIPAGDMKGVYLWGGAMLGLGAAGFTLAIISQYLAAHSSLGYGTNLRRDLYRHVNRFGYAELDKFGTASLITRITDDIRQTQIGVSQFIRLVLRAPFILIGAIVMAIILDPVSGLIFIGVSIAIGTALYFIMRRSGKFYRVIQQQLDGVALLTRENLTGTRVVRAFSRQDEENADFTKAAGKLAKTGEKAGVISSLLNPLTYVLINIAVLAILFLGGSAVNSGDLARGDILALVNYLSQILLALVVFANLLITFSKAGASARRINEVLETEPILRFPEESEGLAVDSGQWTVDSKADEGGADCKTVGVAVPGDPQLKSNTRSGGSPGTATPTKTSSPSPLTPKISLRSVSFAYPGDAEDDLSDISFDLHPGQTLGVIGSTGSGKTTLVNLICRFYDARDGRIEIDRRDIKSYPKDTLSALIGVVPQSAVLFYGSVRENMQLGKADASDTEIWEALRTAQSEDFIKALPQGLDTVIFQGGKNLSGGQRQRLTVARALVKNPEILILDDASSALDYATDAALRKALRSRQFSVGSFQLLEDDSLTKNEKRKTHDAAAKPQKYTGRIFLTKAGSKATRENVGGDFEQQLVGVDLQIDPKTTPKADGSICKSTPTDNNAPHPSIIPNSSFLIPNSPPSPLTVIMVSQRAASLKGADLILVLEDGKCAGLGTYAELREGCEIFKEICVSQEGGSTKNEK